jgi:uncharacterized protein DUF4258
MPSFELSSHARDMLKERKITEEWLWRTIRSADKSEKQVEDNNWHYTKAIPEKDNRVLHVIVNQEVVPYRVVTLFFDRRLRKK